MPNLLSLIRLGLAIPCVWGIFNDRPILVLGVFLVAVLSDLCDGALARHWHAVSDTGTLLDHGADAVFVCCSSAAYAYMGFMSPLLAPLIAFAFLQYVLDSRAHRASGLRASRLGRWNGIGYFIIVGIAVGAQLLSFPANIVAIVGIGSWLLTVTTIVSMITRLYTSISLRHR